MARLTIGFDADDTLWHNEGAFKDIEARFAALAERWVSPADANAALMSHDRQRVATYGFGVKAKALSMISAAIDISAGTVSTAEVATILNWADELLHADTDLIEGALDTIDAVAEHHDVMVITKGDLHHQMRRIEATRIAAHVCDVEVVAAKDASTYARVLRRHQVEPARFVMVGNSIPSDIAPVLDIGGRVVHVPYAVTWDLEIAPDPEPSPRWCRIDDIRELPETLKELVT